MENNNNKMIPLDEACKWIEENIFDYPWWDLDSEPNSNFSAEDIANDFRKAMESLSNYNPITNSTINEQGA